MKERLKKNIAILKQHNLTHEPVYHITDGKKHEVELINEIIEDCEEIFNDEEQGLFVKVPFKDWQTKYFLVKDDDYPYEPTIVATHHWEWDTVACLCGVNYLNIDDYSVSFVYGEDMFDTYEEAEKKLDELMKEKNKEKSFY